MSTIFIASGISHFTHGVQIYAKIVPPIFPYPLAIVYISGFIELIVGSALGVPKLRHYAAWAMVVLIIVYTPATLYHWLGGIDVFDRPTSPLYHAFRVPFQFVMLALAWVVAQKPKEDVSL